VRPLLHVTPSRALPMGRRRLKRAVGRGGAERKQGRRR
jgi:hypothetical protein